MCYNIFAGYTSSQSSGVHTPEVLKSFAGANPVPATSLNGGMAYAVLSKSTSPGNESSNLSSNTYEEQTR